MGAYTSWRFRRALSFVLRPFLIAIALTAAVRFFFFNNSKPSNGHSKALVIATIAANAEERSWLDSIPQDWSIHTYVTDDPISADLAIPINKGREAMVYLTYIIDNYHHLPDIVFFHHDHLKAWHQSLTSLQEVTSLRPSHVSQAGYASARCLPGCENVMSVSRDTVDISMFAEVGRDIQLGSLLADFLDSGKGETVPAKIAAPCCAQFAVSRDAIRARDLEWWTRLRQWLVDVPLPDLYSGRLLEWTWHIWFGQEPKHCPPKDECMCQVFGMGQCKEIWKRERAAA